MRRHHTGSGRRPVIPADWATHHAAVIGQAVEDTSCTVTIGPAAGGKPVFNPALGQSEVPAAAAVYTGPAAVMPVSQSGDRPTDVADDRVTVRSYQVQLPRGAAARVGHVVKVTETDDPMLLNRSLTVTGVELGVQFSRVLYAALND